MPLFQSVKQDWETPPSLLEQLYPAFPFDLDVCASRANVKAGVFFSPEDDGLSRAWRGLCWCNPPYSDVGKWIGKAKQEAEAGAVVLCLAFARTDTRWWQDNIPSASVVTFVRGRLKFSGMGPATAPSALFMFGEPTPEQVAALSRWGWTVRQIKQGPRRCFAGGFDTGGYTRAHFGLTRLPRLDTFR